MKKFVAFFLSIAMVLPLLCTNAYAAKTENESVFEKACELFPEYADTIRNEGIVPNGRSSDAQTRVKVFEETRKYSDSQSITYTEFSDGSAYVTSSDFKRTFEQTDNEILSPYLIRYTCNFSVYATYDRSKKMGINGIKFIIVLSNMQASITIGNLGKIVRAMHMPAIMLTFLILAAGLWIQVSNSGLAMTPVISQ